MSATLEKFAADCHRILEQEPGAEGRQKVCALLEEVLKDKSFVARHLDDSVSERHLLYEDPELGFCIFAHVYHDARESKPHAHGSSWAIYGQAAGETVMSDWALIAAPTEGKPGTVRHVRDYALTPGTAHLYNEGDLHAPRRAGPTKLIRIEGMNLAKVRRPAYVPA